MTVMSYAEFELPRIWRGRVPRASPGAFPPSAMDPSPGLGVTGLGSSASGFNIHSNNASASASASTYDNDAPLDLRKAVALRREDAAAAGAAGPLPRHPRFRPT